MMTETQSQHIQAQRFELKTVLETLIKQAGIREGHWNLKFDFALSGARIGPTAASSVPTACVHITGLSIVRVPENDPQAVDARTVCSTIVIPKNGKLQ